MRQPRYPHLLVAIDGNLREWREALWSSPERPRLPLPYAFGAALIKAGFRLSAIDLRSPASEAKAEAADTTPFETIYPADALGEALRATDLALLWGRAGLSAIIQQALLPNPKRRVVYFSYVWQPQGTVSVRQRIHPAIARHAARFASGVVLMTAEQVDAARSILSRHVPVIKLTVGVDTEFYAGPTALSDIAKPDLARVERLLQSPYVIMPGDELRLNEDAVALVENSHLNLVRISQYGHKNALSRLKAEVSRRNLDKRLLIFERITYPALRFLLRHATAYVGLIDATWQPGGWTVACESLASGLPIVLYEGLAARELASLGAPPDILRRVQMRDIKGFAAALESMIAMNRRTELAAKARAFAAQTLDLEHTGAAFSNQLARAVGIK